MHTYRRATIAREIDTLGMRGTFIDDIVAAIQKDLVVRGAAVAVQIGALAIGRTGGNVRIGRKGQVRHGRIVAATIQKDTRFCGAV